MSRNNGVKRIVIYGGEMSGVCAAFKAASYLGNTSANVDDYKISIILPYPNTKLGGLGTIGGLNAWDIYKPAIKENDLDENGNIQYDENGKVKKKDVYNGIVQAGTFQYLLQVARTWNRREGNNGYGGQWYKTDMDDYSSQYDMGNFLTNMAENNNYIEIIPKMDFVGVDYSENNSGYKTINGLFLRSIYRDNEGFIKWGRQSKHISGDYFIDASDDGKLISALATVSVGRYDWPTGNNEVENILEECEKTSSFVARQQAATLYFKIHNTDIPAQPGGQYSTPWYVESTNKHSDDIVDGDGVRLNQYIELYNTVQYGSDDFLIKTYNLGRNGLNSDELWANTFIMFNVDGRAHHRDLITRYYPESMISDSIDRDTAWIKGRDVISSAEFEKALHGFKRLYKDGGTNKIVVKESNNENAKAVVADILYIRESVHLPVDNTLIGNSTEDYNYALKRSDTHNANQVYDENNSTIYDSRHYESRIGLGYYGEDIHSYRKVDSLDPRGSKVAERGATDISGFSECPVFIPYQVMYNGKVKNLLVSGNAASICSYSWAEMSVLPNQCVIGDAAGIIAAYCAESNIDFDTAFATDNTSGYKPILRQIRTYMESQNICLEKDPTRVVDGTLYDEG